MLQPSPPSEPLWVPFPQSLLWRWKPVFDSPREASSAAETVYIFLPTTGPQDFSIPWFWSALNLLLMSHAVSESTVLPVLQKESNCPCLRWVHRILCWALRKDLLLTHPEEWRVSHTTVLAPYNTINSRSQTQAYHILMGSWLQLPASALMYESVSPEVPFLPKTITLIYIWAAE